jgi:hypothetical protein
MKSVIPHRNLNYNVSAPSHNRKHLLLRIKCFYFKWFSLESSHLYTCFHTLNLIRITEMHHKLNILANVSHPSCVNYCINTEIKEVFESN